jgi:hypothetical protein
MMLTTAILVRDEISEDVIRGTLTIADRTYHVLERPWRNNQCNESCIPSGVYEAKFLAQTDSGKYRNVYELQAVPGRSGILIHSGNVVDDTRGCLLIGLARGNQDGKPAVLDSRAALAELARLTDGENFVLKILAPGD